jgi:hypothetical protein
MFNIATFPLKLVGNPLMNKISKMMSNTSDTSNTSNTSDTLNNTEINSIRMNNNNIGTLKQLSMYGYNNSMLNSYIQQLHHINV